MESPKDVTIEECRRTIDIATDLKLGQQKSRCSCYVRQTNSGFCHPEIRGLGKRRDGGGRGLKEPGARLACAGLVTAGPLILFAGAAQRMDYSVLGMVQYIGPTMVFVQAFFLSS